MNIKNLLSARGREPAKSASSTRFAIALSAEGGINDFRDKMGGQYSATFSDVFGADENFGVLLSVGNNERYLRSYEWDIPGVGFYPTVLPIGFTGTAEIPTNRRFPFEPENDTTAPSENRWSRFDTKRETSSHTVAFDWRPTENTILYQQDLTTGRDVV